MVLGVFKNSFEADEAINTLIEAEFGPESISLIGINHAQVEEFTDVGGALMHTSIKDLADVLIAHGADEKNAAVYHDEVTNGNFLVAVNTEPVAEDVASEILSDANGQHVMTFDGGV